MSMASLKTTLLVTAHEPLRRIRIEELTTRMVQGHLDAMLEQPLVDMSPQCTRRMPTSALPSHLVLQLVCNARRLWLGSACFPEMQRPFTSFGRTFHEEQC